MPKKCIICSKEAVYGIKDSSEYYCEECAVENFADITCLTKVEDDSLKEIKEVEKKVDVPEQETDIVDNS